MKCNSRLYYYKKLNKKGKRVLAFVVCEGRTQEEIAWTEEKALKDNLVNLDYEICDGNVTGKIEAVEEPYMGGTSASLEVNYECDKCKNTYYKLLPDTYNINEWFNNVLNSFFFGKEEV